MEADNSKSCTTLAECFSKHYKEITQGAYGLADKWPFAFDGLAENRKCAATILLHEAYIDASSTFSHFKPERFPSGFSRSCIVSCWGSYIASSRNGGSKSHRVHLLLLKKIHRRVIHLTCSSHPTAPIHRTAMWWLSR